MKSENRVMSQKQHSATQQSEPWNGHVATRVTKMNSDRLCVNPNRDHKSENYEDLQLEFNPHIFGSLEQYLPPHILNLSREVKLRYMRNILLRYFPENDRNRVGLTVTITILMPHMGDLFVFSIKIPFLFCPSSIRSRLFVLPGLH